MTINIHAVKTVLLALTATISFVAAIIVGMGLDSKDPDYRMSCEPTAATEVALAPSSRPTATC